MDLTNRVLKLLIIVAVIIGLSIAFLRGKIDLENTAVEVILDFHEVQEMAELSDIETVQLLKEIKRRGITSIILRAEENGLSNQAFDMIYSAGMKVIPALRIDEVHSSFFDSSFTHGKSITTLALLGDMEQICTDKDEVYLIHDNALAITLLITVPHRVFVDLATFLASPPMSPPTDLTSFLRPYSAASNMTFNTSCISLITSSLDLLESLHSASMTTADKLSSFSLAICKSSCPLLYINTPLLLTNL
jgi:hypothetical protein